MDKKRTKRTYGRLIIGQKQETTQRNRKLLLIIFKELTIHTTKQIQAVLITQPTEKGERRKRPQADLVAGQKQQSLRNFKFGNRQENQNNESWFDYWKKRKTTY
ncbi:uncharacterized protein LOC141887244 [Acropora palmata]|uniref:uncharacterized protein LOC141887244 n=1 Tax=Acropora palmata TaxID=6131 RepID=UPI003DA0B6BD